MTIYEDWLTLDFYQRHPRSYGRVLRHFLTSLPWFPMLGLQIATVPAPAEPERDLPDFCYGDFSRV